LVGEGWGPHRLRNFVICMYKTSFCTFGTPARSLPRRSETVPEEAPSPLALAAKQCLKRHLVRLRPRRALRTLSARRGPRHPALLPAAGRLLRPGVKSALPWRTPAPRAFWRSLSPHSCCSLLQCLSLEAGGGAATRTEREASPASRSRHPAYPGSLHPRRTRPLRPLPLRESSPPTLQALP